MRSILALCLLMASLTSTAADYVARKFSFTYFGNDLGSRTYYSCDSAEDMLKEHLERLGAQSIRTSCFGGIQTWGGRLDAQPVSLSARFQVLNDISATSRVVLSSRSRGEENCDFNVSLLRQLLKVMPNVKLVSRQSSCRGSRGNWNYTLDVAL